MEEEIKNIFDLCQLNLMEDHIKEDQKVDPDEEKEVVLKAIRRKNRELRRKIVHDTLKNKEEIK